ncbi:MAG: phosphoribosylformylglycinamidine synthase II [Omnitrophica WOR_2 bacterium GWF2_38_59]|nr:MAG: phosphoribosylformylglycinamidine synthase II [Omnitrophica WOR_2 bacterium GWF2_38_59]OGX48561.1 MAG: phosphoribosylformylglycinamidine synthase II [Omnitrophica WOR_2 bacterium RIFOXYA2_FULL_38_17]OGX52776.1 MAG: phosphoribosylformylglycinamidine synthase II [Omnitrophica WOR_2 bacterium RIFOXYA12_FULL_38_10]OGX59333.1 MAG: phosphoribosylformylglycinamidine synthase II [Omnitrophica WOR_2 bacterium RIFOXYB2_FULL_38_16]HBG62334.1 phosphoribosylformylglycinamidine synthase subunit PurL 
MNWRIEIRHKKGVFDSLGESIEKAIVDLGISTVSKVEVAQIYNISGSLLRSQIEAICNELLVDKITQQYECADRQKLAHQKTLSGENIIEIAYNPGVMDPVEHSTMKGIIDLGIKGVDYVTTAKEYIISGKLSEKELDFIVEKVLANKLIQHVVNFEDLKKASKKKAQRVFELVTLDILGASDDKLMRLSQEGQLFLNLNEMKAIQKYFKKLKRNPTDCELETVAQTWSEHCYHKTFRGNIKYQYTVNGVKKTKIIKNLLKSTIIKATTEINKPWCVSVFHDNAGVIRFDEDSNICFKAETHNHPSALEPFGGANTGIGGVIRDILGTGLGAKPICCTDVFCFAPPDTDFKDLPPGTLHPKRVMKGVVSGVRDYGNKMGIPTVNGAILFDKKYVGNPLVYCGNVGIMPKDKVFKKVLKGDLVIVAGGKTGRDGIHGATFSSGELTTESEVVSSGAVQIGDPIQEKKLLDALIKARDKNLYTAVTDCGAGGLSSAVGEMGEVLGVKVDLEKVPLKYDGLNYEEIWISESQERMVFSVRPKNVKKILEVFSGENVEATVIGEFTGSKKLELFFKGDQVCDIDMEFLYEGTPKITKEAVWEEPSIKIPVIPLQSSLNDKLLEILSHYNVCSKEWVIRQYDHEVQGGSVIKPLVGVNCDGPSDASVITPKLGSLKGIAISNGINAQYGKIDPFWMAASCIDEAVRQIVSVGGDVERIAILDNFCWGNPDKPDRLGSLVRAAEGCYKTAVGFQVPFISGKDSLYNEYAQGNESIAIPGTILISAIGIVDDVTKTVTMDFKERGNLIYCIGETHDEMGGSIYLDTFDCLGSTVPKVNTKKAMKSFKALNQAVSKGLVKSIHDCSEGGLGVALAEMAFSGMLGATIHLDKVPYKGDDVRSDKVLFSESNSRFVVEVTKADQIDFEKILEGITFGVIGQVEETPEFIVYGRKDEVCVNLYIQDLKEAWQKPLRW